MTITDTVTVRPIIATVRDGHYAAATRVVEGIRVLICVCGFTCPNERPEHFSAHMVAELGHRVQAVAFDPTTGAVTLVCACLHETPAVTDGSAWDLHRAHQDAPTAGPLVPEQGDAPDVDMFSIDRGRFPYGAQIVSATVRTKLRAVLMVAGLHSAIETVGPDSEGLIMFRRVLIDAVRAGAVPGLQLSEYPAGDVLQLTNGGIAIPLSYRVGG